MHVYGCTCHRCVYAASGGEVWGHSYLDIPKQDLQAVARDLNGDADPLDCDDAGIGEVRWR